MLTPTELRNIAEARLNDAEILFAAGRLDGAFYLCGYAIELALKARICLTLGWSGHPSTNYEFQNYQSFRTHNLNVLLRLSGIEDQIKATHFTQWSTVILWNPEIRYAPVGTTSLENVQSMLGATRLLMEAV